MSEPKTYTLKLYGGELRDLNELLDWIEKKKYPYVIAPGLREKVKQAFREEPSKPQAVCTESLDSFDGNVGYEKSDPKWL